LKHVAVLDER